MSSRGRLTCAIAEYNASRSVLLSTHIFDNAISGRGTNDHHAPQHEMSAMYFIIAAYLSKGGRRIFCTIMVHGDYLVL